MQSSIYFLLPGNTLKFMGVQLRPSFVRPPKLAANPPITWHGQSTATHQSLNIGFYTDKYRPTTGWVDAYCTNVDNLLYQTSQMPFLGLDKSRKLISSSQTPKLNNAGILASQTSKNAYPNLSHLQHWFVCLKILTGVIYWRGGKLVCVRTLTYWHVLF